MTKSNKPVVAHAIYSYYSLTANWIETQISHLTRYQPIIVTNSTQNVTRKTMPQAYVFQERPRAEIFANRVFKKIGSGYSPLLRLFLLREKARLLHAHFGNHAHSFVPLVKATRLPFVVMFYGVDASALPVRKPEWRRKYLELFETGDIFLAEGHHMGRQLIGLGCPEHKIRVHHLGVELSKYEFKARRWSGGEPLKILAAGRFTEKKGIVYAVKAFARLVERGIDCRLTIIGDSSAKGDEDAKREILLAAAAAPQVAERTTLTGMIPLDELNKAYYDHHLLISPSVQASDGDNEGGAPVALIEAQATGLPVVSTRHCDIPEVVKDGFGGLLAPERDVEALAACLQRICDAPEMIHTMGAAARRHVEAEYDARRQADKLEQIYDQLLSTRKPVN